MSFVTYIYTCYTLDKHDLPETLEITWEVTFVRFHMLIASICLICRNLHKYLVVCESNKPASIIWRSCLDTFSCVCWFLQRLTPMDSSREVRFLEIIHSPMQRYFFIHSDLVRHYWLKLSGGEECVRTPYNFRVIILITNQIICI